jgi:hypothetical protein
MTHLDAPRWPGFLDLFVRCLEPGGLLVLTTHGRHDGSDLRAMLPDEDLVASLVQQFEETGFGYVDYASGSNYGLSMSSPEWVRERVAEQPGLRLVHHAVRAWQPPNPRQDAVACVRVH